MKFVHPVNESVKKLLEVAAQEDVDINVVPTFPDKARKTLSCIVQATDTDRFGIISVNVEGVDGDVNHFVFNGKLYDYCRAEGFTKEQMVSDSSFDGKVLNRRDRDDFINFIVNG